ncbi:MAG: hypothetical protein EOO13_08440, partial [Chitinophagaceae bacterium]
MKSIAFLLVGITAVAMVSCTKQTFSTNGETIYRTGKNQYGEKLLDKKASSIKFVNSCATCHGKNGDRMSNVSLKFSNLSNSQKYIVPYN